MTKSILCSLTLVLALCTNPTAAAADNVSKGDKQGERAEPIWRTLSPQNTLYMDTKSGRIIFELAQQFSPGNVAHIKQLIRSGFYDGLTFYRVIDGFVVQGGDPSESDEHKSALAKKTMKAEFERTIDKTASFTLVQTPDLLAQQTGFIDGFAVGRSLTENKEWLITCPGVVNLARSNSPDSGTTDFAIMIGQAPRHLDRNMSIFGRIIHGQEHLNLIKRGAKKNGGMIDDPAQRSKIIKMTIAADLPKAQQLNIEIENTHTKAFKQKFADRRKRAHGFYKHKGNGALDICYLKTDVRINK
ncbi:MAG: peptidylprolyl isomerase [Algicola sp.]|nr:peptidylprolyl isomerase [Algicola sp.]